MEAKNLGGAIVGSIIAGASLGVGFIIAQKVMSKVGKDKVAVTTVTTRPMEVVDDSKMSNAVGSWTRKGGKVPCQVPGYNSTVMANSASACTGAGGKVIRS